MIVVMPAGHAAAAADSVIGQSATELFVNDFVTDLMPHVEKHYRVLTDRANTAIAGLSMGGARPCRWPSLVWSGLRSSVSSVQGCWAHFRARGPGDTTPQVGIPPAAVEWERAHASKLDDAGLKRGLRLLWFATGTNDFLLPATKATLDLFKRHGFAPVFVESPAGTRGSTGGITCRIRAATIQERRSVRTEDGAPRLSPALTRTVTD